MRTRVFLCFFVLVPLDAACGSPPVVGAADPAEIPQSAPVFGPALPAITVPGPQGVTFVYLGDFSARAQLPDPTDASPGPQKAAPSAWASVVLTAIAAAFAFIALLMALQQVLVKGALNRPQAQIERLEEQIKDLQDALAQIVELLLSVSGASARGDAVPPEYVEWLRKLEERLAEHAEQDARTQRFLGEVLEQLESQAGHESYRSGANTPYLPFMRGSGEN